MCSGGIGTGRESASLPRPLGARIGRRASALAMPQAHIVATANRTIRLVDFGGVNGRVTVLLKFEQQRRGALLVRIADARA